jgi:hypothetical protein
VLTGAVLLYPSSPVFTVGNSPVQMLAQNSPFGFHLLPQGKSLSSLLFLQATSHSASVGSLFPIWINSL